MKTIKKILLFLWQLPQNLLALLILLANIASIKREVFDGKTCYLVNHLANSGVSLGDFIILEPVCFSKWVFMHELGHQKQSKMLGPLYLLIIGLPSILGNIFDRLFHKNWSVAKRQIWYYSQPWEKWANDLMHISVNQE